MLEIRPLAFAAILTATIPALCGTRPAFAQPGPAPAWVEASNANAQVLLEVMARFAPEQAGFLGVPGHDERVIDLAPRHVERVVEATQAAVAELRRRLESERDAAVRQDLEILIEAADKHLEGARLAHEHLVPYLDVHQTVFLGLRALLDGQVEPARRAALVRLRRYAGLEPGSTPIATLAMARSRERLAVPGLQGPVRDEVERSLANGGTYVEGIAKLFETYRLGAYRKPYAALKQQLAAYQAFVRAEVLPRTRTDFRQPAPLYAFALRQTGVDMPLEELQSRARFSFRELQSQMQALAPLVAREKGWSFTGYRDVIAS